MWEFIRAKVRNAILAGVNDAMAELQGPRAADEQPEPVALLLEYQPDEPASRNGSRTRTATK
jgi:hypothetical protein